MKTAALCEAFGVRCELHMSGFGNLQVLGATSEDGRLMLCNHERPVVVVDVPTTRVQWSVARLCY